MDPDPWQRVRSALLDRATLVRAVGSGRQRNATVPFRRVEARYVELKAGLCLQVTSYDATQAFTRNASPDEVEAVVDDLLTAGYASWHVDTGPETLQLRVTKKGRPLLHASARDSAGVGPGDRADDQASDRAHDRSHDRAKQRRLGKPTRCSRCSGSQTIRGPSSRAATPSSARCRTCSRPSTR